MALQVIGAGLGRTGTDSLKLALNELGLGPCHHMSEMEEPAKMAAQVPLWQAALDGKADWPAVFAGYQSAVDWPTAGFVPEISSAYPEAKVILTLRPAESWAKSFAETVYKLLSTWQPTIGIRQDWFHMAAAALERTGLPKGLDNRALIDAFEAHNAAIKALISPERLLAFEAKQGWAPLCAFLGVPVPDTPFPRSNDTEAFKRRSPSVAT